MAAMKTLRQRMADDGLQPYIVTVMQDGDTEGFPLRFWAEDVAHAGEQADDWAECEILLVETQDEYEARTGETVAD